jgi:predicted metal-dependent hydrolase
VKNSQESPQIDSIRRFYQQAFRHYDKTGRIPPVSVEIYPYSGINHTIRLRGGRAFVRISDICVDMDMGGQRALAFILVAKLYRKQAASVHQETYNSCLKAPYIQRRAASTKKVRGRKTPLLTDGDIYDLDELFDEVNDKYFNNSIRKPNLTWSSRKTYRVLGHHDATQDKIVISRSLDTPETPRYIVEYVMFHEMLHVKHPTVTINGRRYNHTSAFRADERKFPKYHAAERWIESNVRRLKRAAKKK